MFVSMVSWWVMECVCRQLWAMYPPTVDFLYDPHVDPVKVTMALNPTSWGRFVAFSMWLQGHSPHLTDRVEVYKTLLHRHPNFISCIYGLLGRWLRGKLWQNGANARRRSRRYFRPTQNPEHPALWGVGGGYAGMLARKR